MAVPFSNTKLRVPHGFQALLEGIAREILHQQPTDIYAFGAMYFENLLKIREGGEVDPASKLAQIEDRMYNNKAFKTPADIQSMEEEREAAVLIQTKYRQYEAKTLADDLRQNNAAVKIQAGIRGYLTRQQLKASQVGKTTASYETTTADDEDQELQDFKGEEGLDSTRSYGNEQNMYSQLQLSEYLRDDGPVADDAPLSAATDGELRDFEPANAANEDEELENGDDADLQKAVTKIQAGYRGMKTRAELKNLAEARAAEPVDADDDGAGDEVAASQEEAELADFGEPAADEDEAGETQLASAREGEGNVDELTAEPEVDDERNADDDDNEDTGALNGAASKIQAGFRGMKTRRELQLLKDSGNEEATESPLGEKAVDSEEQNEEAADAEQTVESDDQERTNDAATKIQAGFRGMKTRKELQVLKDVDVNTAAAADEDGTQDVDVVAAAAADEDGAQVEGDESQDEINNAAAKIQAGFRGMKTRKELALLTESARDAENVDDQQESEAVADAEADTIGDGTQAEPDPEPEPDVGESAAFDAPADDEPATRQEDVDEPSAAAAEYEAAVDESSARQSVDVGGDEVQGDDAGVDGGD